MPKQSFGIFAALPLLERMRANPEQFPFSRNVEIHRDMSGRAGHSFMGNKESKRRSSDTGLTQEEATTIEDFIKKKTRATPPRPRAKPVKT